MKPQMVVAAGLVLVVGLAALPVHAQSATVLAKIPFRFTIAEKTFPAGDYLLMTGPHQVTIADPSNRVVAIVLANEVSDRPAGQQARIAFHCYGTRCFLWEVWPPARGNGRRLFTSRGEVLAAQEARGQYFALLGEAPLK